MNRRPIIIDTDPGIDDAVALAIALFAEALDVQLVTTVVGNVNIENVTMNALKLLTLFNKRVPVAKGASEPLIERHEAATHIHGLTGMGGYNFPEPDMTLLCKDHAVNVMREMILRSSQKVTLVPIGPLTNIALLFKMYPEVKNNIAEIVLMGGSLGRGNRGVMSEFNVATDPEAAKIVFNAGLKVTMLGLDIGIKAALLPSSCVTLKELNEVGKMIYELFQFYRSGSLKTGLRIFDATAIAYLLKPEMFEVQHCFVDVELHGTLARACTVVDLDKLLNREPNVYVCTNIDAESFNNWFVEAIAKCHF